MPVVIRLSSIGRTRFFRAPPRRSSRVAQIARVEIFPWNDNFNTGLAEVDQQHRQLVSILNDLAMHVAFHPEDHAELNRILEALLDYTRYHFRTEEAIWHQHLPDDEEEARHLLGHRNFIETIS